MQRWCGPAFFLFESSTAFILRPKEEDVYGRSDMIAVEYEAVERVGIEYGWWVESSVGAVSVGGLCRNFATAKSIEVVAFLSSMIEITLSQDTSHFTYSGAAKVKKSTDHLLPRAATLTVSCLPSNHLSLTTSFHELTG